MNNSIIITYNFKRGNYGDVWETRQVVVSDRDEFNRICDLFLHEPETYRCIEMKPFNN